MLPETRAAALVPHDEFFVCRGKVRFSKKKAKAAARRVSGHFERGAAQLEAYFCRFCQWWHVGHRKGWHRKQRQKVS